MGQLYARTTAEIVVGGLLEFDAVGIFLKKGCGGPRVGGSARATAPLAKASALERPVGSGHDVVDVVSVSGFEG